MLRAADIATGDGRLGWRGGKVLAVRPATSTTVATPLARPSPGNGGDGGDVVDADENDVADDGDDDNHNDNHDNHNNKDARNVNAGNDSDGDDIASALDSARLLAGAAARGLVLAPLAATPRAPVTDGTKARAGTGAAAAGTAETGAGTGTAAEAAVAAGPRAVGLPGSVRHLVALLPAGRRASDPLAALETVAKAMAALKPRSSLLFVCGLFAPGSQEAVATAREAAVAAAKAGKKKTRAGVPLRRLTPKQKALKRAGERRAARKERRAAAAETAARSAAGAYLWRTAEGRPDVRARGGGGSKASGRAGGGRGLGLSARRCCEALRALGVAATPLHVALGLAEDPGSDLPPGHAGHVGGGRGAAGGVGLPGGFGGYGGGGDSGGGSCDGGGGDGVGCYDDSAGLLAGGGELDVAATAAASRNVLAQWFAAAAAGSGAGASAVAVPGAGADAGGAATAAGGGAPSYCGFGPGRRRRDSPPPQPPLLSPPCLVTFEGSARGLHFEGVDTVFVVGRPRSAASYLHLAGRVGRHAAAAAAAAGTARGCEGDGGGECGGVGGDGGSGDGSARVLPGTVVSVTTVGGARELEAWVAQLTTTS